MAQRYRLSKVGLMNMFDTASFSSCSSSDISSDINKVSMHMTMWYTSHQSCSEHCKQQLYKKPLLYQNSELSVQSVISLLLWDAGSSICYSVAHLLHSVTGNNLSARDDRLKSREGEVSMFFFWWQTYMVPENISRSSWWISDGWLIGFHRQCCSSPAYVLNGSVSHL